jgi:two-component system, NtrC family, response regulator AtoC
MTQGMAPFQAMVGTSARSLKAAGLIKKLGNSRVPTLIFGETGTGKEVAARAIHEVRNQGAFVPIDCAALSAHLVESELFGHEKGAFTGALATRPGLLQMADGGTAFFDEVGELPLDTQAKLLRTLQQQEIRPVGSNRVKPCTFRILAATNRDLRDEVSKGRFRLDLYYRLDVVTLELPPLRECKHDIPLLFNHFLRRTSSSKRPAPGLMEALLEHAWPGNIRELENCVARLVALSSDEWLRIEDLRFVGDRLASHCPSGAEWLSSLPAEPSEQDWTRVNVGQETFSMVQAERAAITRALADTKGSNSLAAKALGISRTTLYRKLKQYGEPCNA